MIECAKVRPSVQACIAFSMNDLRNVLIHQYEGTDADLVWAIVERDIPVLLAAVRDLLAVEGK